MNLVYSGLDEQTTGGEAYSSILPELQKELESIYLQRLMSSRFRRTCPVCGRLDLKNISTHLYQVNGLSFEERKPYQNKPGCHHGIRTLTYLEVKSLLKANKKLRK